MTADLPGHIRHGFVRHSTPQGTHYFRCLHCGRDKLFAVVVGNELEKVREAFVRDHGSCKELDVEPERTMEMAWKVGDAATLVDGAGEDPPVRVRILGVLSSGDYEVEALPGQPINWGRAQCDATELRS